MNRYRIVRCVLLLGLGASVQAQRLGKVPTIGVLVSGTLAELTPRKFSTIGLDWTSPESRFDG